MPKLTGRLLCRSLNSNCQQATSGCKVVAQRHRGKALHILHLLRTIYNCQNGKLTKDTRPQVAMSRTARREANNGVSVSVIQVGANTIFKPAGSLNLLPTIRTAVELSHKILLEGHMLATLHILRLLQHKKALPPLSVGKNASKWQTFMDNCYAAVSQAVGPKCQQFSPDKEPELATTYHQYQQCLPPGHIKPTRPTWMKHVSLSWHFKLSQLPLLSLCTRGCSRHMPWLPWYRTVHMTSS